MNVSTLMEDNSGGFSATRLAFLLWVVGLLVIWLISSAKTGTLNEIPNTVLTLVGILMGGKVVQRFGERSDEPSTDSATAPNSSNQQITLPPKQQVAPGTI